MKGLKKRLTGKGERSDGKGSGHKTKEWKEKNREKVIEEKGRRREREKNN